MNSIDLAKLLEQREELDQQIDRVRKDAKLTAIMEVKKLIGLYNLTLQDLGLTKRNGETATKGRGAPRGPVAPRFRDPESGATWSGRGKAPRWIAGKDRNAFLI
ncbi:hypothetical protein WM40_03280 [Robbsia andropogonis]|uniref:DNA-binding protein H-NS-like C-terminal domain-containing protein n=1 Tax=Robbsia andropogonis TaxID=28092 RepID=A0A0F5K612_9BURK|nr:H-NS histone family protein [Robbsia andropogonis]KKB64987.1 hypothetical protein WM40_03280 [Robbsia andropogonis]MCP1118543.1 H-NS histone family protein [Robbsia andropogonis]MCP1128010.1 H-NS histone family protein [Robbsia andropogonis]